MTTQERRKYFRLKLRKPLKHTRFSLLGIDLSNVIQSESKDLSAGGLLFESNHSYAVNDIVRMEINLSGWEKFKSEFYKSDRPTKSEPVVVLAKVVRVESLRPGHFDIGVSFVGIDDGHQMALIKYIKSQTK